MSHCDVQCYMSTFNWSLKIAGLEFAGLNHRSFELDVKLSFHFVGSKTIKTFGS